MPNEVRGAPGEPKPNEADWAALKRVVADALALLPASRLGHLEAHCSDAILRGEAERLLRACERAEASPVLSSTAAELAAPVLAEVEEDERGVPDELREALAGRYTIEREVGRGGMATVYLARDERHGRPVALKLLRPASLLQTDSGRGARLFQREIEVAARLSHPHILPLHDSGAVGGSLYYIMPYVDGETVRDRLRREGPLPLAEALRILRDVARALSHAHRQGLVHRDVKPSNILLSREGDALVADFGVARGLAEVQGIAGAEGPSAAAEGPPSDETFVFGTPAYMAPEQVEGSAEVDHRADLYALGVVAYELLTGTAPFADRPRAEQLEAQRSETPDSVRALRPDVPEGLAALVDRLLAKRPDDRPRDADEVLRLLDGVRADGGAPVGTRPAGTPERLIAVQAYTGRSETEDRGAHELYLKARYLSNSRERESLLRALSYFEEAVRRDPGYARAHAGVADTWTFLGIFSHAAPLEAFPKAMAAARRAVELEPELVEGHATLAHLLFVSAWDWEGAASAFQRALAVDPGYPRLRMYHASYLHSVGRPEDALAQLALAREIDPLAPTGLLSGRIYVDTGRPDEAVRVLQEEIEMDERLDLAHQLLAHACLQKERPADAVASMTRAAELSGPRDLAQLAYVHARTGDRDEARRVLAGVLGEGVPDAGGPSLDLLGFHIAMAYAGLGDADGTFHWLERAYAQRASFMNLLAVSTGFESVRGDARFGRMLGRMGLG